MTYIKKSVHRAQGNPGVGLRVHDELVIYDVDDIASFPEVDENGVMLKGDIVLKSGRYGYTIYGTPGTFEATSAAEGDTDKMGFMPAYKFSHPGNSRGVREFKVNHINRRVVAALRHCNGEPTDIIGSPCNPCKVTPSYTGNNDANANEFTIQQVMKGDDVYMYEGTLPLEEPVATIASGSTEVTCKGSGQYQLSAGEAAIASISGGADGDVITLRGCAGTAPTVAATAGKIMLKGGKVFTAVDGAQITLRAFNDGGANLVWIEQARFVPA